MASEIDIRIILAEEQTLLSRERTMHSYMQTGLTFTSVGLVIVKFLGGILSVVTGACSMALECIIVEIRCLNEAGFMKMFVFVYADYFEGTVTTRFKQAGYNSYFKVHNMTSEYEGLEPRKGGPAHTVE